MSDRLWIEHGGDALALAPEQGGCVAAWRVAGVDILRPAVEGACDPRDFAAFPMVPFVGRIAQGCFVFDGEAVTLPANLPPEPHAIHGQGWQVPWRLARRDRSSATLVLDHDSGDWPWAYRAEQVFRLEAGGLTVALRLTNTSPRPMPGGLGWHPYFPAAGAEIEADVAAIWREDRPEPLDEASDLTAAPAVAGLGLDHAFSAGAGGVRVTWPEAGRAVRMSADPVFGHLVVYTPPGEAFFCAEPASHAPNAVNSDLAPALTGYRVLAPGEAMTGKIHLAAVIRRDVSRV